MMQLNKYLALCGLASRRKANMFIVQGRIKVNEEIVNTFGRIVHPEKDRIFFDGQLLSIPRKYRYVLLNKPGGVITSALDGRQRKTVLDCVNAQERLFPVGRLDMDTEGVLLLTNDGDLAYRLTHPRYRVEKVYEACVQGIPHNDVIRKLKTGIRIYQNVIVHGDVKIIKCMHERSWIKIIVHEGKKRQIKRMMKAVGHPVIFLKRTCFAGLTVDDLEKGKFRDLTKNEIATLYQMTGLKS